MKAMSKSLEVGGATPSEALDKAYKSSQERHDRERLMAIRLVHHGNHTLEQIGSILKRGRATIARWLKAYREGGIEKLLHRGHGGPA
jgi:transposase